MPVYSFRDKILIFSSKNIAAQIEKKKKETGGGRNCNKE